MRKPLLAAVVVAAPVMAYAQDNQSANFEHTVQAEAAMMEVAGIAKACGLRPSEWVTRVSIVTAIGVQNVATNLWPGPDHGMSARGNEQLTAGLKKLTAAFGVGMTAKPKDCQDLIESGALAKMDDLANKAGAQPDAHATQEPKAPSGIVIQALTCKLTNIGPKIEGLAANNTNDPQPAMELVATFRAADGSFVSSDTTYDKYRPLLVGQAGPFWSYGGNNPDISYVEVTAATHSGATLPTFGVRQVPCK